MDHVVKPALDRPARTSLERTLERLRRGQDPGAATDALAGQLEHIAATIDAAG